MPGPLTDLAAIVANDRHTVFISAEDVARRCGVMEAGRELAMAPLHDLVVAQPVG